MQVILKSILLLITCVVVQIPPTSYVEWSPDRKLTWDDFKGNPDPALPNAAMTNASIKIDLGYDQNGFRYAIHCRFDKEKSWGRVRSDYILAHEQGHFDITEIYARKLNRALQAYRFNNKTVEKDVNNIYDSIIRLHHQMQEQYDAETDFSIDRDKQAVWLQKIKQRLDSLAVYAAYPKSVDP